MQNKPRVFVVQETERNIEPAKKFGSIQVLLTHKEVLAGIESIIQVTKRELSRHLVTEHDFILCIGDPIAIGIAMHMALTETDGNITALRWDKHTYVYHKIQVSMKGQYGTF